MGEPLLVARWWRGWIGALAAVSAAVFVVLAVRFQGEAGPGRLDAVIGGSLPETSEATRDRLYPLVLLGSPTVFAVLVAVVALAALSVRRPRAAVLAVVGPVAVAGVAKVIVRPLVDRTLYGILAFPSGHTITLASVATAAALIVAGASHPRARKARAALVVAIAAVPVAEGILLIILGLHVVTDVVGSITMSLAVIPALALALDAVAARVNPSSRRRKVPVP